MTTPALARPPALIDGTGTKPGARSLDADLLARAARDDYPRWLAGALAAGGCVRPIRLRGTIRDIDPATGEILYDLDTSTTPDQVIYLPCGDRRASVCPPCAETYRADTYQLIRAGLAGGKGMPESVAIHPCVFATFTAPSFGPVHTHIITTGGRVARCRPRRKHSYCPHGRRLSCGQRHKEDDSCLGRPLCPDCYDYAAAVVWNAHAPELWRRTVISIRRALNKLARSHGVAVRLSYAKAAEFQRRGLIHFHAIFRLDGIDPVYPERVVPPRLAITAEVLAGVIRDVAAATWFATVSHPAKPKGWDIGWGDQVDPRIVRRLLEVVGERRNGARWVVALALGLRQGEALGLKWSDVDLDQGTLRIRRGRLRPKYEHGCGGICGRKPGYCPDRKQIRPDTGDTKSRAGKRTMGLPEPLIALFRKHKRIQDEERVKARQLWHDEGWVFANPDGRPLNPNTDYHEWKDLLAEAGLRDARLHDARHTAATVLLILGVPTPTAMALMGWSSAAMAKRYQHLIDIIRRDVAKQAGGLLWDDADPQQSRRVRANETKNETRWDAGPEC